MIPDIWFVIRNCLFTVIFCLKAIHIYNDQNLFLLEKIKRNQNKKMTHKKMLHSEKIE